MHGYDVLEVIYHIFHGHMVKDSGPKTEPVWHDYDVH